MNPFVYFCTVVGRRTCLLFVLADPGDFRGGRTRFLLLRSRVLAAARAPWLPGSGLLRGRKAVRFGDKSTGEHDAAPVLWVRPTQTNRPISMYGAAARRREALSLYRSILRASRAFYWENEQGEPWSRVLRKSARKEFEQCRHEVDPLEIARMIVVGHNCIAETEKRFTDMEESMKRHIASTRGQPGGTGRSGHGGKRVR